MRIFSYIIASLTFVAGLVCIVVCIGIAPKFMAIYEEMGADLPVITRVFLGSSRLIPGAILVILAVTILSLALLGMHRSAATMSGLALLVMLVAIVILPMAFIRPISIMHDAINDAPEMQKAEQSSATDALPGWC